jgi:hypothetical protein
MSENFAKFGFRGLGDLAASACEDSQPRAAKDVIRV